MSDESQRPIIIKRIKKGEHGAHGGVWKLAYADFMTAMMAFFLLMWLLGSTAKSDLQAVGTDIFDGGAMALSLAPSQGTSLIAPEAISGGKDITKRVGVNKDCNAPSSPLSPRSPSGQESEFQRIEQQKLEAVQSRIAHSIESSDFLKQYANQLKLDITAEGLRIQIVDEQNRPMFTSGSAQMLPHAKEILRQIGMALNDVNNSVSISGHTDAMPYSLKTPVYSNWELSADRANAARRELIGGGMRDSQVLRVVGLGSSVPYDPDNIFAPVNRRISIVVLNRATEEAILSASGEQVSTPAGDEAGTAPVGTPPAAPQQAPVSPATPPQNSSVPGAQSTPAPRAR